MTMLRFVVATTLLHGVASWHMSTVERIRVQDFDPVSYYENGPKPLLISGVLSPDECEQCCDEIMSLGDELLVDLQNQYDGSTEVYQDVPLVEALDTILYESTSQDAFLSFCEGLLDAGSLDEVNQMVTQAREDLFASANDPDWFSHYFPRGTTPSDAVVLAGAGATSTLHRDPFEWMGTSLCIEGSKVWRFIDPHQSNNNVQAVDDALKSYRLKSIAWDDAPDGASISAGWQSDLSLYEERRHDLLGRSREWAEMENELEKLEELVRVGSSTELLTPNVDSKLSMTTAIQRAGELLLIPAHWWHQTYALEPSAAIASQRCGHHDARLVLQHILDQRHITSTDAKTILATTGDPVDALKTVLDLV